MDVRKSPCDECAFTRDSTPADLGGSPVETYIGQALGPFCIPCHKACDFRDPYWKDTAFEVLQCGGMAIFRTHLGVADLMPDALPTLPASDAVFATPAEFMAHHLGIPLQAAEIALTVTTPAMHLIDQLKRPDNRVKLTPKKDP